MPGSQLIALVALTVGNCLPFYVMYPAKSSGQGDTSARKSLRVFLDTFDSHLKDRYDAVFVDLNGDGKAEAIVYLKSKDWCGSGGCTTLILARDGDSWKLLTKISITRPPIRVLAGKSSGWRSIGVWVQGGGIQPGYEGWRDADTTAAGPLEDAARQFAISLFCNIMALRSDP